ncbi:TPA: hypothetical protein SCR94_003269 [Enterobacter cloacae]|uniref:Uncharacterized protein n=2 Tax=Enterobacter cloacae TaxID=550 RepID=A0AAW6SE99_ENTCL|nr:hypothetical protein [Enterobacter cloacae]EBW8988552.1 hypothetical protein [Salmonella enterica subsp. enterica serovar Enteritidis]AVL20793.1 hypothetical protein B2J95_23570 [Enterobacter cloacae]KTJ72066.1 hypothetical protein ASU78_21060 [Enterobacter cloacae subsp. cloacae]MCK1072718.1 hypothetical protein [Enterobacter cloacae subsp. cloacae]MCL8192771.1 hypothetical protein [Enterobacter cloacae]
MDQDLQNALAFYQPAPDGWFSGLSRKMEAAGVWVWETIQGDFNDNQTTGQVVTGTLISMIPLVDQICDVRDLIANSKNIKENSNDTWAWVALALTLVGIFPVLGSLAKGGLKLVLRKIGSKFLAGSNLQNIISMGINDGLTQLNKYLDIPAVQQSLHFLKISNAYEFLEKELRKAMEIVNANQLSAQLDKLISATEDLLDTAKSWGPESIRQPINNNLRELTELKKMANVGLAKTLGPLNEALEQLANRLHVEGDNAYRAYVGENRHILDEKGMNRASEELELLKKEKPDWVDKDVEGKYSALGELKASYQKDIKKGWPDISDDSDKGVLKSKYNTFDDSMHAVELPSGTRLYRIVDSSSTDNSICWMREEEFLKLKSKSDWRRNFAVWKSWNENGEYVVYTVPKGEPLKVWEGRAATQVKEEAKEYSLEGGAVQIVVDPAELKKEFTNPRMATGWGEQDVSSDPLSPFTGLPSLTNKWYE